MDDLILPSNTPIASIDLSYLELNGNEYDQVLETIYTGPDIEFEDDEYYSQEGVQRTVVLARYIMGLPEACIAYHELEPEAGIELLISLQSYMEAQNELLPEFDLAGELTLVDQLLTNMDE